MVSVSRRPLRIGESIKFLECFMFMILDQESPAGPRWPGGVLTTC